MGHGHVVNIWKGQPIYKFDDRLDELVNMLPTFNVRAFGDNIFLQQVVRLPQPDEQGETPVSVVSKNYQLFQHQDVVRVMRVALRNAGLTEDIAQGTLYMSTYGERIEIWVTLRGLDFDPGDGHPLHTVVICQNSVDGSCALEFKVIRVRSICSNGMISGHGGKIRRVHSGSGIGEVQTTQLLALMIKNITNDHQIYTRWYHTHVTCAQLDHWADEAVAKVWGNHDAARLASICRSGYDGMVQSLENVPPSCWQVGWDVIVPGANAPVENAYHAAQALSWVASRQNQFEERDKCLNDVTKLVEKLIDE